MNPHSKAAPVGTGLSADENSRTVPRTLDVEAVVLAGGHETRLRPLTTLLPKSLLPLAGTPILEHLLCRIREAGIRKVALATPYQTAPLFERFGEGSLGDLKLIYLPEREPLGQTGALMEAVTNLSASRIAVFHADVVGDADLCGIVKTHVRQSADVTIHVTKVDDPGSSLCFSIDETGRVTAIVGSESNLQPAYISAGLYIFERSTIEPINTDSRASIDRGVLPRLLADGCKIVSHDDSSYWRDINTPECLVQASADLINGLLPSPLLPSCGNENLIHDDALVAETALISGGSFVGRDATISPHARVEASIIMDGAYLDCEAVVERTIVGENARIGARTRIRNGVVGDNADVGADCELASGVRVWPAVRIPNGGIRFSADV